MAKTSHTGDLVRSSRYRRPPLPLTCRQVEQPLIGWTRGRWVSFKRVFDIAAVVASTPIWAPLLLLAYAAVKIGEPGHPAFFVQWRTGHRGTPFRIVKLRTMVVDAAEIQKEIASLNNADGPQFKLVNDPRRTRVGAILRKTYLDELPQMINILRGDMTLVGPRPATTKLEEHVGWRRGRLQAMPGLTGPWQLRDDTFMSFDNRVRMEIAYRRQASFFFDVAIMLRTLRILGKRNGV